MQIVTAVIMILKDRNSLYIKIIPITLIRHVNTVKSYYRLSIHRYTSAVLEIGSKRVCCIGVNTDMGLVYLFNVYMPCDTNTNEHLCDYNMILTDIAKYCDENGVLNCVIG